MLLKPNIEIMLGLNFGFLSGNSVTSLTRWNWRTSFYHDYTSFGFHSRMLVESKDLSAAKCKNNA